jgi:transposase
MIFIGIDVASNKHDCCILGADGGILSEFTFTNDRSGFDSFLATASVHCGDYGLTDTKVGLESTGHYSTNLTNYLFAKRLSVKIFNPLQVNLLRKAQSLRKTKTDKSDARFLATLLFSDDSKPYSQPLYHIIELKALVRNRYRLVGMRSKLKISFSRLITILFPELPEAVYSINQKSTYALLLEFPTAKSIAEAHLTRLTNLLSMNSRGRYGRDKALEIRELASRSIGLSSRATGFELRQTIRLVQGLQKEIDALDDEIKTIMLEIDSPLLTIPGVGYTLGAIILAEIGSIENFATPAKLLKFAGLEPSIYESGKYKASNTPMVKRGSKYLRWALLQAARLVAYRDKSFGNYMSKKRQEGKHFLVAISHVAKKLVRVVFHLLRSGESFAPQAPAATM